MSDPISAPPALTYDVPPAPPRPASYALPSFVPPLRAETEATRQSKIQNEASHSVSAIELTTAPGFDAGFLFSHYRYQEHLVPNTEFMHQTGLKYGFSIDGTAVFPQEFFLTGDVHMSFGQNDYWSAPSGKISNFASDVMGDARLLGGKDFVYGDTPNAVLSFDISPYTGIGFRDLYNDSSKISGGYRRNSEYFYVPLGLTNRFRISSDARIAFNGEYDLLLLGRQTSYLNDATITAPNAVNDQNHGYGVRGSVMYERRRWAVGPFVDYWNINQSNVTYYEGYTGSSPAIYSLTEPHNQTLEYGMQARYHF